MVQINRLEAEIKDLELLIKNWKTMIVQFPEDKILVFSLPPYENRLKELRQALQQLKKEEFMLEVA